MPKFYFHIYDASGVALDDEGIELVDLNAVRYEVQQAALAILTDLLSEVKDTTFRVSNQAGKTVLSFPVMQVIARVEEPSLKACPKGFELNSRVRFETGWEDRITRRAFTRA